MMSERIQLHTTIGADMQFYGYNLSVNERDLREVARRVGGFALPERGVHVYVAIGDEYGKPFDPEVKDHILRGAGRRHIYVFLDRLEEGEDASANVMQHELTLAVADNFEALKYQRNTRRLGRGAMILVMVSLGAIIAGNDQVGASGVATTIALAEWVRWRRRHYEAGETPPFVDQGRVAGLRPIRVEEYPVMNE